MISSEKVLGWTNMSFTAVGGGKRKPSFLLFLSRFVSGSFLLKIVWSKERGQIWSIHSTLLLDGWLPVRNLSLYTKFGIRQTNKLEQLIWRRKLTLVDILLSISSFDGANVEVINRFSDLKSCENLSRDLVIIVELVKISFKFLFLKISLRETSTRAESWKLDVARMKLNSSRSLSSPSQPTSSLSSLKSR